MSECRALTAAPSELQRLFDADPERTLAILHRITAQDATTFTSCKIKQANLAAYIRRVIEFYEGVQADIAAMPE